VWGRFGGVHRRSLSGIYCRRCADRTALRASFVSWLAGWWSWPHGPRETRARLITIFAAAASRPIANARLLIRQARAFQKRGDTEPRAMRRTARHFARNPALQQEIAGLMHASALGPAGSEGSLVAAGLGADAAGFPWR